ncbi:hypothetical protein D3C84_1279510 [compost metagenome]
MVHRRVVAGLVKQPGPEILTVIVVSHGPDDLSVHCLARGLNDGPEFRIRLGLALVSKIAGENHGFRTGP